MVSDKVGLDQLRSRPGGIAVEAVGRAAGEGVQRAMGDLAVGVGGQNACLILGRYEESGQA